MIERSIVEKAAENLRHSERWSRKDIVTVCKAAGKYEELKKAGADAQAIREITFSAADIADVFIAPRHFVRYSDRLIRAISTKTDKMVGALTETSDQFDAGDYGLFSYRKEINDSRLKQKSEEVFGAYKTAAGSFLYIESWNDEGDSLTTISFLDEADASEGEDHVVTLHAGKIEAELLSDVMSQISKALQDKSNEDLISLMVMLAMNGLVRKTWIDVSCLPSGNMEALRRLYVKLMCE